MERDVENSRKLTAAVFSMYAASLFEYSMFNMVPQVENKVLTLQDRMKTIERSEKDETIISHLKVSRC